MSDSNEPTGLDDNIENASSQSQREEQLQSAENQTKDGVKESLFQSGYLPDGYKFPKIESQLPKEAQEFINTLPPTERVKYRVTLIRHGESEAGDGIKQPDNPLKIEELDNFEEITEILKKSGSNRENSFFVFNSNSIRTGGGGYHIAIQMFLKEYRQLLEKLYGKLETSEKRKLQQNIFMNPEKVEKYIRENFNNLEEKENLDNIFSHIFGEVFALDSCDKTIKDFSKEIREKYKMCADFAGEIKEKCQDAKNINIIMVIHRSNIAGLEDGLMTTITDKGDEYRQNAYGCRDISSSEIRFYDMLEEPRKSKKGEYDREKDYLDYRENPTLLQLHPERVGSILDELLEIEKKIDDDVENFFSELSKVDIPGCDIETLEKVISKYKQNNRGPDNVQLIEVQNYINAYFKHHKDHLINISYITSKNFELRNLAYFAKLENNIKEILYRVTTVRSSLEYDDDLNRCIDNILEIGASEIQNKDFEVEYSKVKKEGEEITDYSDKQTIKVNSLSDLEQNNFAEDNEIEITRVKNIEADLVIQLVEKLYYMTRRKKDDYEKKYRSTLDGDRTKMDQLNQEERLGFIDKIRCEGNQLTYLIRQLQYLTIQLIEKYPSWFEILIMKHFEHHEENLFKTIREMKEDWNNSMKLKKQEESNNIKSLFETKSYLKLFYSTKKEREHFFETIHNYIIPIKLSNDKALNPDELELSYSDLLKSESMQILITGEGGSGKTTMLRKLVLDYNNDPRNCNSLGVYIDLSEYREGGNNLEEDIKMIEDKFDLGGPGHGGLLILDGFDEMSQVNKEYMCKHPEFEKKVKHWNDCGIKTIFSSRYPPQVHNEHSPLFSNFENFYANKDLDDSGVFDFISMNIKDYKKLGKLLIARTKHEQINNLLKKPLFLSMICYVINDETLSDDEDLLINILSEKNEYEILDHLISEILDIYLIETKNVGRSESKNFIKTKDNIYKLLYFCSEEDSDGVHNEEVQKLIDEIGNLSGLPILNFTPGEGKRPELIHQTLRDVLLAKYIKELGKEIPNNEHDFIFLPEIQERESYSKGNLRYLIDNKVVDMDDTDTSEYRNSKYDRPNIISNYLGEEKKETNKFCRGVKRLEIGYNDEEIYKKIGLISEEGELKTSFFPNLEHIRMSSIDFITSIEPSQSILSIEAFCSGLKGNFETRQFTNLELLEIDSCYNITNIEGSNSLKYLYASCTGLSGKFKTTEFPNIEELSLRGCKDIDDIEGSNTLKVLYLSKCGIGLSVSFDILDESNIEEYIEKSKIASVFDLSIFPSLEILDVNYCKFISEIQPNTSIKIIHAKEAGLSGNFDCSKYPSLEELDVSWCEKVTEILPSDVIKSISASGGGITGVFDCGVFPILENAILSQCPGITDIIPSKTVKKIDFMADDDYPEAGVKGTYDWREYVNLKDVNLEGHGGLISLLFSSSVEKLNLSYTGIGGILDCSHLKNPQKIEVRGCDELVEVKLPEEYGKQLSIFSDEGVVIKGHNDQSDLFL